MTDNPPARLYVNQIESRIIFELKTGSFVKLLMPGTMKLPGSTKNNITKDENWENILYLKTAEVVLVLYKVVDNND